MKDSLSISHLFLIESYDSPDRTTFNLSNLEDPRLMKLTFFDLLSEVKSIVYVKDVSPFIQIILKGGETRISSNDNHVKEGLYENLFRFIAKYLLEVKSEELFVNSFNEVRLTQYDSSDFFVNVEFLINEDGELPYCIHHGTKIKSQIVSLLKSQQFKCVKRSKRTIFNEGIEIYKNIKLEGLV